MSWLGKEVQVYGINVNIFIWRSSFQIHIGFWLWSITCLDTEGFRALCSEQSLFLLQHAKMSDLSHFYLTGEYDEQPANHFPDELPLCVVLLTIFLHLFICLLSASIYWVPALWWFMTGLACPVLLSATLGLGWATRCREAIGVVVKSGCWGQMTWTPNWLQTLWVLWLYLACTSFATQG